MEGWADGSAAGKIAEGRAVPFSGAPVAGILLAVSLLAGIGGGELTGLLVSTGDAVGVLGPVADSVAEEAGGLAGRTAGVVFASSIAGSTDGAMAATGGGAAGEFCATVGPRPNDRKNKKKTPPAKSKLHKPSPATKRTCRDELAGSGCSAELLVGVAAGGSGVHAPGGIRSKASPGSGGGSGTAAALAKSSAELGKGQFESGVGSASLVSDIESVVVPPGESTKICWGAATRTSEPHLGQLTSCPIKLGLRTRMRLWQLEH